MRSIILLVIIYKRGVKNLEKKKEKLYQQAYGSPRERKISIFCSSAQKRKFDEVVAHLNKSKTAIILDHISELYEELLKE